MNINEILKSDYDLLCKDYKKATKKIEKQEQEIERLNKESNDLRVLYQRTYKHLYDIGNNELAGYFQAQIGECRTFYVEPVIDYYEETKRLNNIINELEKEISRHIALCSDVTLNDILDKLKELKENK